MPAASASFRLSGWPDALDDQPERDRDFERKHWQPHELGNRTSKYADELNRQRDREEDGREHTEPGQRSGDHAAAEQQPAKGRAADSEESRGDDDLPP